MVRRWQRGRSRPFMWFACDVALGPSFLAEEAEEGYAEFLRGHFQFLTARIVEKRVVEPFVLPKGYEWRWVAGYHGLLNVLRNASSSTTPHVPANSQIEYFAGTVPGIPLWINFRYQRTT